jgi:hypothetical protein
MVKKGKKKSFEMKYVVYVVLALVVMVGGFLIFANSVKDDSLVGNCGDGTVVFGDESLCWQSSNKLDRASSLADAISYCDNLDLGGRDDWRVPDLVELSTIVDDSNKNLAINDGVFLDTMPISYWTISPYANKDDMYWYISFTNGHQGYAFGFQKDYGVRCVRTRGTLEF